MRKRIVVIAKNQNERKGMMHHICDLLDDAREVCLYSCKIRTGIIVTQNVTVNVRLKAFDAVVGLTPDYWYCNDPEFRMFLRCGEELTKLDQVAQKVIETEREVADGQGYAD